MNLKQITLKKIVSGLYSRLHKLACSFMVSRDQAYWSSLKGRYQGQRGWVIGNGPSLKVGDLDRLQGEVCVASNKIYLAFDQTKWRPSFITVVDEILWPKIKDECLRRYSRIHLPHMLCGVGALFNRRLTYWRSLPPAKTEPKTELRFSPDVAIGMHGGFSVTFENIQLANYLGLNPIYIIGCDHYYGGESDVVSGRVVEAKVANHFHPDYRKAGELVNPAPIEGMNRAYEHARVYADLNRVKIYNATRGGHLEIFERRDLDEVLTQVENLNHTD